jgi:hypothetical protein
MAPFIRSSSPHHGNPNLDEYVYSSTYVLILYLQGWELLTKSIDPHGVLDG